MDWVSTAVNGLLLGGLYGLFGLGLALVFGVMRVVNLAHGEFIVIGAFLGVFLVGAVPQIPPWVMALPVALAGYALGWALQVRLVSRAQRGGDILRPLMLTFGLSVVLRTGADRSTVLSRLPAGSDGRNQPSIRREAARWG